MTPDLVRQYRSVLEAETDALEAGPQEAKAEYAHFGTDRELLHRVAEAPVARPDAWESCMEQWLESPEAMEAMENAEGDADPIVAANVECGHPYPESKRMAREALRALDEALKAQAQRESLDERTRVRVQIHVTLFCREHLGLAHHPLYGPPMRTYQDGGMYVAEYKTIEGEGLSTIHEFRFEAAAVDLLRASCAELLSLQEGLLP